MTAPTHAPDDCQERDCRVLRCKLAHWRREGLAVGASASPVMRASTAAPRRPDPSWERGIPTDSRNMPFLDRNLNPMGAKAVAENRSRIESARRRAHQAPAGSE